MEIADVAIRESSPNFWTNHRSSTSEHPKGFRSFCEHHTLFFVCISSTLRWSDLSCLTGIMSLEVDAPWQLHPDHRSQLTSFTSFLASIILTQKETDKRPPIFASPGPPPETRRDRKTGPAGTFFLPCSDTVESWTWQEKILFCKREKGGEPNKFSFAELLLRWLSMQG